MKSVLVYLLLGLVSPFAQATDSRDLKANLEIFQDPSASDDQLYAASQEILATAGDDKETHLALAALLARDDLPRDAVLSVIEVLTGLGTPYTEAQLALFGLCFKNSGYSFYVRNGLEGLARAGKVTAEMEQKLVDQAILTSIDPKQDHAGEVLVAVARGKVLTERTVEHIESMLPALGLASSRNLLHALMLSAGNAGDKKSYYRWASRLAECPNPCLLFEYLAENPSQDPRHIEVVYRGLRLADRGARYQAYRALKESEVNEPRTIQILESLLDHPDPSFSGDAAQHLALLASSGESIERALSVGLRLAGDPEAEVRKQAAIILGEGILGALTRASDLPFPRAEFKVLIRLSEEGAGAEPGDEKGLPHETKVVRLGKENVRWAAFDAMAGILKRLEDRQDARNEVTMVITGSLMNSQAREVSERLQDILRAILKNASKKDRTRRCLEALIPASSAKDPGSAN